MFVPNTCRRAAVALGLLAVAPLLVLMWDLLRYPEEARLATRSLVVGAGMMLALGYAISAYGTHIVHSLRLEAHEARQLDQYRLRNLLGAGGMGEVYLAEHQLLKRPCAIKLIRPGKADDPRALARFELEVRATATLSHWNTVEIYDYGHTEDGTFYYVMEYLPGLSLAELLERFGRLPAERVIHLLAQTCEALAEAHGIGLVHRDLKPGNISAAYRGGLYDVAKLLDFGLVKPLAADESLQLTLEGSITGSPLYMAPEQAMGEGEADARADIYSLGAVAYHLLCGVPPFRRDKALQVLMAHARDEVRPPSLECDDIPPDLERVVMKCLEKRPEDRYQSASEVREALLRCAAAGKWTRTKAAQWWQQSDPLAVASQRSSVLAGARDLPVGGRQSAVGSRQ